MDFLNGLFKVTDKAFHPKIEELFMKTGEISIMDLK